MGDFSALCKPRVHHASFFFQKPRQFLESQFPSTFTIESHYGSFQTCESSRAHTHTHTHTHTHITHQHTHTHTHTHTQAHTHTSSFSFLSTSCCCFFCLFSACIFCLKILEPPRSVPRVSIYCIYHSLLNSSCSSARARARMQANTHTHKHTRTHTHRPHLSHNSSMRFQRQIFFSRCLHCRSLRHLLEFL
jgi:hypothetical protein